MSWGDVPPDVDLGGGWRLWFVGWHPDRDLNPQYAEVPDAERYGAVLAHPLRPGDTEPRCLARGECQGSVTFASDTQRAIEPGRPAWEVASWEPLTMSPSVLCHCGAHGFVQDGRWVSA